MTEGSLTHKQILFIEHYIQTGGNGTAAARAAGYQGNTATLAAVAHENLNKPHIQIEIGRRQQQIRDELRISIQAKRERLWAIANEAGRLEEISRTVETETAPDGTIVKTIHIQSAAFDPAAAIKAIHELNLMDGDCPAAGKV